MDAYTQWTETPTASLTPELVDELLDSITDDLWAIAACTERVVDDVQVAQVLVKTALKRSQRIKEDVQTGSSLFESLEEDDENTKGQSEGQPQNAALASYFKAHSRERRICVLKRVLLDRLDRIQTFQLMSTVWRNLASTSMDEDTTPAVKDTQGEEEDDPWAESFQEDDDEEAHSSNPEPPLSLSEFLSQPLVDSALLLASLLQFPALKLLLEYHSSVLFPFRFTILDAIPLFADPSNYRTLLPANDFDSNLEVIPDNKPWRAAPDWVEGPAVLEALKTAAGPGELEWLDVQLDSEIDPSLRKTPNRFTSEELSAWYLQRIEAIEQQTGLLSNALSLLQHGASQGILGLDELGEELILLERLVYDAPSPSDENGEAEMEDWTLQKWRSLDPEQVINAYLQYSTIDSIALDIRRLVLPYLSVLEAQSERKNAASSVTGSSLLYSYILKNPSIHLVHAIFEASKPTIQPKSLRIIRTDEDVARIALAYLYGRDDLDNWTLMSGIFECLPDWGSNTGRGRDEDEEESNTTFASLASFVTPSASGNPPTPEELYLFFKPLGVVGLGHALDILDVHLEGGEILDKWGVGVSLRWFLRSSADPAEQKGRAVRMARRVGMFDASNDDEETWRDLLDDMLKLSRDAAGSSAGLKGAFGLLSKEEIAKIFFSGLLSTGNFKTAKSILARSNASKYLTAPVVEDICLTVSREMYDNSTSGNLHRGEMKLAYDCLSVAHQTPRILKERAFIEATSKITAFKITADGPNPITPLEIRLTKDKLSLIGRILSSTEDAYKATDVMLELVHKLGVETEDDGGTGVLSSEVKVLAMLADAALQAEDFAKAEQNCERMVEGARKLKPRISNSPHAVGDSSANERAQEAVEVAWRSLFQLGRQPEFHNTTQKLKLLAYALELCPTNHTMDVLNVWRRVEAEDMKIKKEKRALAPSTVDNVNGSVSSRHSTRDPKTLLNGITQSRPASLALAALTGNSSPQAHSVFDRVSGLAASLRGRDGGSAGSSMPGTPGLSSNLPNIHIPQDVTAGARHVLSRGVGWLIGADEDDDPHGYRQ